jgi:hypothetical protein
MVCPFVLLSVSHCIICHSPIYGSWFPLIFSNINWYLYSTINKLYLLVYPGNQMKYLKVYNLQTCNLLIYTNATGSCFCFYFANVKNFVQFCYTLHFFWLMVEVYRRIGRYIKSIFNASVTRFITGFLLKRCLFSWMGNIAWLSKNSLKITKG